MIIFIVVFIGSNFTLIPVAQTQFVKVKSAALNVSDKALWKKGNITAEECATKCVSDKTCFSFETMKESGECYLLRKSAATSKEMIVDHSRDYYQQIKRKYFSYFIIGILLHFFPWNL